MAKKIKTYKCRYKNCLHESREVDADKAVCVGNARYHSDCYKTKEDIKEIKELFVKHINPNPVYDQLQLVINNIVFTKKLGSDFLLFGLRYYIENKISLNYPQGLYYVIQNKKVIEEYNKRKKENIKGNFQIETENDVVEFEYKPSKIQGFADIIR